MRAAPHRLTLVGAMVLAAGLSSTALTGCVESPKPLPSSSSTPDAAPVFASDEEALAAAEKAYAAYLAVSDQVFGDGGDRAERFEKVAISNALEDSERDASEFEAKSLHSTGKTLFKVHSLQSATDSPLKITVYVCDDVSNVDLLDSDGKSLVSPDRVALTPFVVSVVGGKVLRVSERQVWAGEGFCN